MGLLELRERGVLHRACRVYDPGREELRRQAGGEDFPGPVIVDDGVRAQLAGLLAAVLGRAPLVVTGGSTPAQGLPGEHNCGDIDPAIPLALAADPAFGPERANLVLTRESGFLGMLGYQATLAEVLEGKRGRVARVREHLLYQMALAAGSGLAALTGLDGVVFSGRYASHGAAVAGELLPKIERVLGLAAGSLPWRVFSTPLPALVAEAAIGALLERRQAHASCA